MKVIIPLGGRIIVRPLAPAKDPKDKFIDSSQKEKPTCGHVVAVFQSYQSPLGITIEPNVHKGDLVFFSMYAGVDVEFEGETYRMMLESELTHAIVDDLDDDDEFGDNGDYQEEDIPADGTMIEEH